ncbi:MAG: UvrD-helicase domain-containing protein [Christensenella sp.]
MKLTEKQTRAIETQEGNVLVSAAAGSGKTSVLAKRVARIVAAGGDIRAMLVMTFTNAAASEMRRRIAREIKEEAERSGSRRLYEQAELVTAADISTFHSFCGKLVRKNYALLGLSASVRIMNGDTMNRVKSSVARELMDELYEAEDKPFLRLLRRYTKRGNDSTLAEYLLNIHDAIMSKPEPFAWVEWSEHKNTEEYIKKLKKQYDKNVLEQLYYAQKWVEASERITHTDEPMQNVRDLEYIEYLTEMREYAAKNGTQELRSKYMGAKLGNITNGMDPERKQRVQYIYKEARKQLKAALETEAVPFEKRVQAELLYTQEDACAMFALVRAFHERYAANKLEDGVLDYSDMEHFALTALSNDEVRASVMSTYEYIFVDEYQDTNPVQEKIISAVSGEASLFMVGDIKQSIYKFRLADPFIFREKARAFKGESKAGELILMNDNFRSAQGVIDAVNGIMQRVMSESLGDVDYDENERLNKKRTGGSTEILLCEEPKNKRTGAEDCEEEEHVKHAKEACMIADSIQSEIKSTVTDKSTGKPRPTKYGDIAVLFRSRGAMIYVLKSELERRGIPCAINVEQANNLAETELFVNVLRLIDNPTDDVALLSVMRSYIGGMDEQELAQIKAADENNRAFYYESAERYAKNEQDEIAKKLRALYTRLDFLRVCAVSLSAEELLARTVQELDFETYIACTPNGDMKQAMFSQFLELCTELISTQANSLYMLLNTLKEIKKRDGTYIKTAVRAVEADCVHISTIHSSKGLEYPIVYVINLERTFSIHDFKNKMLIHDEYGLMPKYIDDEKLYCNTTTEMEIAKGQIQREALSEELRVLYVAMTRAQEKLKLAGSVENIENAQNEWRMLHDMGTYENAKSMLDWVMAANADDFITVNIYGEGQETKEQKKRDVAAYCEKLSASDDRAELLSVGEHKNIPAKVSVSAVKRANKNVRLLTPMLAETEEITGARLGTLVHSMMERVVFAEGDITQIVQEMFERKLLTEKEREAVLLHADWITGFLHTPLYERIKNAKKVLREQPFNLEVEADSIGYDGEGKMLVQGILDIAFLEGEWVLVDYKTDRVTEKNAEEVARTYAVQLELYARALMEITGVAVKEKYLYFLRLQKCVKI